MPKAHIHDGALTIPLTDEIRERLDVHEGDEIEAQMFGRNVVLRSASPDARERAWERLFAVIDQVRVRPGQPEMTAEEVDRLIDEEIKAAHRARHPSQHD